MPANKVARMEHGGADDYNYNNTNSSNANARNASSTAYKQQLANGHAAAEDNTSADDLPAKGVL